MTFPSRSRTQGGSVGTNRPTEWRRGVSERGPGWELGARWGRAFRGWIAGGRWRVGEKQMRWGASGALRAPWRSRIRQRCRMWLFVWRFWQQMYVCRGHLGFANSALGGIACRCVYRLSGRRVYRRFLHPFGTGPWRDDLPFCSLMEEIHGGNFCRASASDGRLHA